MTFLRIAAMQRQFSGDGGRVPLDERDRISRKGLITIKLIPEIMNQTVAYGQEMMVQLQAIEERLS